jgi:hypothetical protein
VNSDVESALVELQEAQDAALEAEFEKWYQAKKTRYYPGISHNWSRDEWWRYYRGISDLVKNVNYP